MTNEKGDANSNSAPKVLFRSSGDNPKVAEIKLNDEQLDVSQYEVPITKREKRSSRNITESSKENSHDTSISRNSSNSTGSLPPLSNYTTTINSSPSLTNSQKSSLSSSVSLPSNSPTSPTTEVLYSSTSIPIATPIPVNNALPMSTPIIASSVPISTPILMNSVPISNPVVSNNVPISTPVIANTIPIHTPPSTIVVPPPSYLSSSISPEHPILVPVAVQSINNVPISLPVPSTVQTISNTVTVATPVMVVPTQQPLATSIPYVNSVVDPASNSNINSLPSPTTVTPSTPFHQIPANSFSAPNSPRDVTTPISHPPPNPILIHSHSFDPTILSTLHQQAGSSPNTSNNTSTSTVHSPTLSSSAPLPFSVVSPLSSQPISSAPVSTTTPGTTLGLQSDVPSQHSNLPSVSNSFSEVVPSSVKIALVNTPKSSSFDVPLSVASNPNTSPKSPNSQSPVLNSPERNSEVKESSSEPILPSFQKANQSPQSNSNLQSSTSLSPRDTSSKDIPSSQLNLRDSKSSSSSVSEKKQIQIQWSSVPVPSKSAEFPSPQAEIKKNSTLGDSKELHTSDDERDAPPSVSISYKWVDKNKKQSGK